MSDDESDYWSIGALREELAALDQAAEVYIDNRHPTALMSYRGIYAHLAIARDETVRNDSTWRPERDDPFNIDLPGFGTYSPGIHKVDIKADPTVAELVKALDLAIGATFEGYKGGQFTMRASTDIWVSEYGRCDSLRIVAIETLPGRVDLITREEDW